MSYRFGDFEFDPKSMELLQEGQPVSIKPKALELLELLVQNSDRVVTKDEVFEIVWQGRIVSDASLTTTVKELRHALGDTGKTGCFVKTYYGRGLRFVGDLLTTEDAQQDAAPTEPKAAISEATITPDLAAIVGSAVAVLPFDNMTGDEDKHFFGDGIAEDMILALSRFQDFTVISRAASFAFRDSGATVQEIGAALNVRYVVQGSFRRTPNRVRLSVQLIDTETGMDLWAERYDRHVEDLFDVQDSVTSLVVSNVAPAIGRSERRRARLKDESDLNAWENYHRGIAITYGFDPVAQHDACVFFDRAIEQDPTFAQPYAGMAYALNIMNTGRAYAAPSTFSMDHFQIDQVMAERYALSATELAPTMAMGWFALARTQIGLRQSDLAIDTAKKAVSLNPNQASALFVLALALWTVGRSSDAIAPIDRCLKVVPEGPFQWMVLAMRAFVLTSLGRYDQAAKTAREALKYNTENMFSKVSALCSLGHSGRTEEARQLLDQIHQSGKHVTIERFNLIHPILCSKARNQIHEGLRKAGLHDE
ncbi:MAG: winged helix-turn-helix domain-containing protein [Pseudomonadota bacterium]